MVRTARRKIEDTDSEYELGASASNTVLRKRRLSESEASLVRKYSTKDALGLAATGDAVRLRESSPSLKRMTSKTTIATSVTLATSEMRTIAASTLCHCR